MNISIEVKETLMVPHAPVIPGSILRAFRGKEDYPAMVAVIEGCKAADRLERTQSVEDVARSHRHLVNCDPSKDVSLVENNGQVIGYSRVWWQKECDSKWRYNHFAFLLPEWRGRGIRRAMVRHNELRLREIAAQHQTDQNSGFSMRDVCLFEAWAADTETHWQALLISEGYKAVRHSFEMERPSLDDIPDLPLPAGLEIRPVRPEHHWVIWKSTEEAFRDNWGETEWQDEWLEEWKESPTFQPELWQVAWDGEQVAGVVQNLIDLKGNREFQRRRGYIKRICVRRPWRRKGLARALTARSFQVLKNQGMTAAALDVDAQNPNGALRLYESLGFRMVRRHTIYRKMFD